MLNSNRPCGWAGTISSFLKIEKPKDEWLVSLKKHHKRCMGESAKSSQISAWRDTYKIISNTLEELKKTKPGSANWSIIFEYELPRERGRRPDVLILAEYSILVLEFKGYNYPLQAHLDQVKAYSRDLKNYHAGSHDAEIMSILVLASSHSKEVENIEGTFVVSPNSLIKAINNLITEEHDLSINLEEWLAADYSPLPSLVTAARTIFQNEPLPQIRRARSAGIPETIEELVRIVELAHDRKEMHIALVTGVPGSGKTLVGLQFVYANHFNDEGSSRRAVFLSGNGPLVKVLQHALRSSVFVQDIHGFLKQYGGNQNRVPEEHIWVYDEAQRAWDADRVKKSPRGKSISEPEDFLLIAERLGDWAFMVGLIGEGQEISWGEEAGLAQWNQAIKSVDLSWIVHCPTHVADLFTAASQVYSNDSLNLTTSLRTHLAEDVQLWVSQLLEEEIQLAEGTAAEIFNQGFDMYITRDLEVAKAYVQCRYQGELDKRYGLLASSKAKNLSKYGIANGYIFTRNLRVGPWYNDPPYSDRSCCQLRNVATEFECQGLELDLPIIGWGDDLRWSNNLWQSSPQGRSKARDYHQLVINSYRVLLTRGRDGFVIFVPPTAQMDETYSVLTEAGLSILCDRCFV